MVCRLDLGQISLNPVENVVATSITFSHIVTRPCAEIKILDEKVTYVLRLFDVWISFFRLSFFSFSILFAAVIDLLLGLLAVKKLLRKRHRDGQFLAWTRQV